MLEYGVQVRIGNRWEVITCAGNAMVYNVASIALDVCETMREQDSHRNFRVAVRSVGDWCEMKRKVVAV